MISNLVLTRVEGFIYAFIFRTNTKTMATESKYLTIEEASTYTRLPVHTIYQLTRTRRLRHYKPGRRLFFLPEDLDSYMKSGVVAPMPHSAKANKIHVN
jgi:excisionase family DNA binding protein